MTRSIGIRLITGLVLGAFVFTITGCDDNLVQNPDFINPDAFYENNDGLAKGVNGIYANLGGENGGGQGRWFNWFYDRYVFEERVGYQVGWEKGPLTFQQGNVSTTDQYIQAFWEISYQSINRANGAIEAAQNLEGESQNEDRRQRLLGEAQFLRGFYYYYLTAYFDSVPLTTQRTEGTSNPEKASKSEVVQQVIEDASAAASNLPGTYEGANKGRATKWAAKTLLMKAHLMAKNWNQARTVAEEIMAPESEGGSPHSLYDEFVKNWEVEHENEYTGGRIFEGGVSASADADQYSNHHAHFVPPDHEFGQGWHWLWTTKQFRMRYDENDNRIPGTFLESYNSVRPQGATAEDPVEVEWSADADFSLGRFNGVVDADADPSNPDELKYGGGWSRKWVEDCGDRACWNSTEKNIPYLRYSEVLLGHTEAAINGGTADGGNDFGNSYGIDQVRTTRGLSTVSATMDNLVKEWMLEFAFEQKGYVFLKRVSTHGGTDYLGQWVNDFVSTYDVTREHREKEHVLPIPQTEVDANPNVDQHPLWQ